MLSELFPDFSSRDANDSVLAGIEVVGKLKEIHSDRAFFELEAWSIHGLLDDVGKKLPASLARAEGGALYKMFKFRADGPLA
jgi:hypothetical protein